MGIQLGAGEGPTETYVPGVDSEPIQETVVAEQAVVENQQEVTEEFEDQETGGQEPAVEENEIQTFSEEEVMEILNVHEQKTREQIKAEIAAEQERERQQAEQAKEVVPAVDPMEQLTGLLNEVLGQFDDDDMVTGASLKAVMTQVFTKLHQKSIEVNTQTEAEVFTQGAQHYLGTYVPKLAGQLGFSKDSMEAEYIQNSFISILGMAKNRFGDTPRAVEAAAAAHMQKMHERFKGKIPAATKQAPVKPIVETRLASPATGGQPKVTPSAPVRGVTPESAQRIVEKKASISEILAAVNSKNKESMVK